MVGLKIWSVSLIILYHFCQRCIPCGISTHVEIGKTSSKWIFLCFEFLVKISKFRFSWKAEGGNYVKVMSSLHNFKNMNNRIDEQFDFGV